MIFRQSQKLADKIKAEALPTLLPDENPFADWSAGLFLVRRLQYILVTNTKSLYSTALAGKGVTDEKTFIDCALRGIRALMEADGQQGVYERFVAPASADARFAKALNRSVTGSMNDMAKHAAFWLAAGDVSPDEIGARLNKIPMSALKHGGAPYGFPRDVFKSLVDKAERSRQ